MNDPDKLVSRREASVDFPFDIQHPAIRTDYEALHLLRQFTARFSFSHFMIARIPSGDQQRFSERLVFSNWPAELVRDYDAAMVFQVSALIAQLRRTRMPIFAPTALLLNASLNAPVGAQVQFDGQLQFDSETMLNTFAVLLHTTYGEAFVVLLSGARTEPDRMEKADLYLTLLQLFETLERSFDTRGSARDELSARELECLRLAAAGKSTEEIAIIFGISVYTVASYFKTATRKLDSVNRMQAIARAMRMKLI